VKLCNFLPKLSPIMSEDPQRVTIQYELTQSDKVSQIRDDLQEIAESLERIESATKRINAMGELKISIKTDLGK